MKTVHLVLLTFLSVLLLAVSGNAQSKKYTPNRLSIATPKVAVKTNLLYDLTTSINLGLEVKTGSRYSLDVSANYNPWTFSGDKKIKHFFVQPEFRYWFCEPFNEHFIGIHGIYGQFNVGGISTPKIFKDRRYQGDMYGAGISYGYQWYLSPRLNLEATIGVGYIYFDYTTYECKTCGKELASKTRHYFGPTKLGLTLLYIL